MRRSWCFVRDDGRTKKSATARPRAVWSAAVWIVALEAIAIGAPAASETSSTVAANEPTTICASHILVRFWGSRGATIVRTSDTALGIARQALAKALAPGADFEAVGREFEKAFPDVTFEHLDPFGRGKMEKNFEDVVFALKPGQVADFITTTPYGFHIIRRNPTIRCREILIAYSGASRATVARTRDEARRLAESLREEAIKPGTDFAALARRSSDAPDRTRGGDVGVFDKGMMVGPFEKVAFALKVGDISPVVESRFGFHIIQRIE